MILDTRNPAVRHHLRHTEHSLGDMARIHAHSESIVPAYREVYAAVRESFMIEAQAMYWLHCRCLSQLANGTYRSPAAQQDEP